MPHFLIFFAITVKGVEGVVDVVHTDLCVEMDQWRPSWYILQCVPAVTSHLQSVVAKMSSRRHNDLQTSIAGIQEISAEAAKAWQMPKDEAVIDRAYEIRRRLSLCRDQFDSVPPPTGKYLEFIKRSIAELENEKPDDIGGDKKRQRFISYPSQPTGF